MVRLIGGNVVANHNSYPEIMNERGVEKSHWYWLESLLVLVKHLYVVKSPCQESPVQHQQPMKEAHTLLKATWREAWFAGLGKVTPRMITQPSRWILLPTARWVPLTLLLTARPVAVQAFSWDEYCWSDWIPSVSVKLSDVPRNCSLPSRRRM